MPNSCWLSRKSSKLNGGVRSSLRDNPSNGSTKQAAVVVISTSKNSKLVSVGAAAHPHSHHHHHHHHHHRHRSGKRCRHNCKLKRTPVLSKKHSFSAPAHLASLSNQPLGADSEEPVRIAPVTSSPLLLLPTLTADNAAKKSEDRPLGPAPLIQLHHSSMISEDAMLREDSSTAL